MSGGCRNGVGCRELREAVVRSGGGVSRENCHTCDCGRFLCLVTRGCRTISLICALTGRTRYDVRPNSATIAADFLELSAQISIF